MNYAFEKLQSLQTYVDDSFKIDSCLRKYTSNPHTYGRTKGGRSDDKSRQYFAHCLAQSAFMTNLVHGNETEMSLLTNVNREKLFSATS